MSSLSSSFNSTYGSTLGALTQLSRQRQAQEFFYAQQAQQQEQLAQRAALQQQEQTRRQEVFELQRQQYLEQQRMQQEEAQNRQRVGEVFGGLAGGEVQGTPLESILGPGTPFAEALSSATDPQRRELMGFSRYLVENQAKQEAEQQRVQLLQQQRQDLTGTIVEMEVNDPENPLISQLRAKEAQIMFDLSDSQANMLAREHLNQQFPEPEPERVPNANVVEAQTAQLQQAVQQLDTGATAAFNQMTERLGVDALDKPVRNATEMIAVWRNMTREAVKNPESGITVPRVIDVPGLGPVTLSQFEQAYGEAQGSLNQATAGAFGTELAGAQDTGSAAQPEQPPQDLPAITPQEIAFVRDEAANKMLSMGLTPQDIGSPEKFKEVMDEIAAMIAAGDPDEAIQQRVMQMLTSQETPE